MNVQGYSKIKGVLTCALLALSPSLLFSQAEVDSASVNGSDDLTIDYFTILSNPSLDDCAGCPDNGQQSMVRRTSNEPCIRRQPMQTEFANRLGGEKQGELIFSGLRPVCITAGANVSYLIPMDAQCRAIMHNCGASAYLLSVSFRPDAVGAQAIDIDYGLPTFEVGLQMGDYHHIRLWRKEPALPYHSRIGRLLTLYGGFRRDLFRNDSGRWRIGYTLENGIGYCTHPYNKHTNADNEIVGSAWNIYIDLGFYTAIKVAPQWEIGFGVDYKHYSNSALDRPNKGANNIGLTARASYLLAPDAPPLHSLKSTEEFKTRVYVDIAAGLAGKSLLDDWMVNYWERTPDDPKYRSSHFPIYGAFTCMVAPMWRYCRRYASGIGIDYTYAPYADRLQRLDISRGRTNYSYSRHVIGVSLRHEVFWRRISLGMGIGWYAHRKMGYTADVDEKPYYETVGVRYTPPIWNDRLYIGYQVKAHFTKADCMQLLAGVRL